MAIIDLAITAAKKDQGFRTAPGGVVAETAYPVGLTWFTTQTNIAALDAANQTHIRLTMPFDPQYSYIFKEIQLIIRLASGTTHDFNQFGTVSVANAQPVRGPNGAGVAQFLDIENDGISFDIDAATAVFPTRHYHLKEPFHQLMRVFTRGTQMNWVIQLADESADATVAGQVRMVACFYRYGIEQSLSAELNAPAPVLIF